MKSARHTSSLDTELSREAHSSLQMSSTIKCIPSHINLLLLKFHVREALHIFKSFVADWIILDFPLFIGTPFHNFKE